MIAMIFFLEENSLEDNISRLSFHLLGPFLSLCLSVPWALGMI